MKCQVHVHGHARHFPARSVIYHDPIVTSVCVQVPRDTERPPGRLVFHLARVISAVMYLLCHVMYLRRGYTLNTTLFGHHRCESLDFHDLARARTGQPGGLGN